MNIIVEFPKSSLPYFKGYKSPDLIWMRCKNPTKTMTRDGLYQGYIYTHLRGTWGGQQVTLFHFINDKGIHSTCSLSRFSRPTDSYVAKKIKENEQKVNKDNPVPSLEWLQNNLNEPSNGSTWKECIKIVYDAIFQNGRETDKEQPINFKDLFDSEDFELEVDSYVNDLLIIDVHFSNIKRLELYSNGTFKFI